VAINRMCSLNRIAAILVVSAAGLLAGCVTTSKSIAILSEPTATTETLQQFAADRIAPVSIGVVAATSPAVGMADLQRLAAENSPALKQAVADVAAARGAAVQAGLYPNPKFGYQGDQIGSGHTAGQQGAFLNQTIVTKDKLGLAQAAALADVARAEANLQQVQSGISAAVRARYYALMTAVVAVQVSEEMARIADSLADRMQKLFDSKQPVANHDVAQARALAAFARAEVIQSSYRRTAAEKQLATVMGSVGANATEPGSAERPLPTYSFDRLQEHVLANHSEIKAAGAQVDRARLQHELARVTMYPNVETNTYVQYDYSTNTPQFGLQVGVALPIFDRNQGNIAQSQAHLVRASHEAARARQELSQRLAEAFERYAVNRRLLEQYRNEILPAQRSAAEGVGKRFEQEPGKVSFSEVVLAQQTLATTYTGYLTVLAAAWQAVADLSRLAQTEEPIGGTDSWPEPITPVRRKP
jgi:outer membrane protein, heavy metal efflux system